MEETITRVLCVHMDAPVSFLQIAYSASLDMSVLCEKNPFYVSILEFLTKSKFCDHQWD